MRLGFGFGVTMPSFRAAVAAAQALVARSTYSLTMYGSSSTEGGQSDSTTPATAVIAQTDPASTKAIVNRGAGGSFFDSGGTSVVSQMTTYPDAGGATIQFDNNGFYGGSNYGGPETRRTSFIANAIPVIPSGVVSGRRWLAWCGTDVGFAFTSTRADKMRKLLWADYPGQVVNEAEYFAWASPADPTDAADQAIATFPRSYQEVNRSHLNGKGYSFRAAKMETPFAEAINGGPAYFPIYPYYSNASTAQTLGGAVLTLSYIGDLAGTTLALLNLDGSPNAEFAISSSTAAVARASSAIIKVGRTDLLVQVTRPPYTARTHQISIAIGNLTGAISEMTLDGYGWGMLETNDNKGTANAPSFTAASRQYAGLEAQPTEVSLVMMLKPGAAVDGLQVFPRSTPGSAQVTRLATGSLRVRYNNDAGTSLGQLAGGTTQATGPATSADPRRIIYYSASTVAARQRLLIVDYDTGNVLSDSGPVTISNPTNIRLHGLASVNEQLVFGNAAGGTMTLANAYKGLMGLVFEAAKEIDFTVVANQRLFFGPGAPANFMAADAGHTGDGRSVIVQAGGTGANVGATVTPHLFLDGHAAEFMSGRNRGTGGNFTYLRMPDAASPMSGRGMAITA